MTVALLLFTVIDLLMCLIDVTLYPRFSCREETQYIGFRTLQFQACMASSERGAGCVNSSQYSEN